MDACLLKDEAGNFIASPERSDVVHDLLGFLAKKMLEMNKQKQTEVEGFLAVLKKNGIKLAVDPARRKPAETLRAEFEGTISKLRPL